MTEPAKAVFLSYASQDADAARRICDALRAAGIEVWFDQSELRGGDAWDQSIRRQIKTCALFIPIVSRHTHERAEGYFRLEWKLAVDRSHLIMANKAFLLPVVIDDTGNDDEHVPEKFREVQWTQLPNGETPAAFVERVERLLSGEASTAVRAPARPGVQKALASAWSRRAFLIGVLVAGAAGYLAIERPWVSKPAVLAAFAPPPHSIAVLPFVNMSGDKEQEYFSDGLTEELLNSLAEINELQVAARTSAFSFKGKDTDIGTIARKLNVGAVLEGSVRRSGNTVRVTTQLINAVTGFHLWSHTYDRDLGDVLKLETEIASDVASALKVSLLGDGVTKIEVGGTHNPAAFDAYLRARRLSRSATGARDVLKAIAGFTEAIRLDPTFALAFAWRSLDYSNLEAGDVAAGMTSQEILERQEADAHEAIRLAPELTEGYDALGRAALRALDFTQAREAFERALALAPGNTATLAMSSYFLDDMGQFDAAISAARRAVTLDPLNVNSHRALGVALYIARRYREAIAPFADASSLQPESPDLHVLAGSAHYMLRDLESAKSSCEHNPDYWLNQWCLAMVYDKLGRRTDAEGELAKVKSALADSAAYQYAAIYAQWGDRAKALEWLGTAMRLRDGGLTALKTDPLMDPLRQEPRFQAIMQELKFPD
jgi:TolB-like protein/cytochrome c-type biogenesis protein CcmH/NrfG